VSRWGRKNGKSKRREKRRVGGGKATRDRTFSVLESMLKNWPKKSGGEMGSSQVGTKNDGVLPTVSFGGKSRKKMEIKSHGTTQKT